MLFRDAKLKIQQASMSDFLVRRIIETRRYIERESGVPISDEDFYAALAVVMMESRDGYYKAFMDHLCHCVGSSEAIFTQDEMAALNSVFPGTFLPVGTPRQAGAPVLPQIGGWRYAADGQRYWYHGVIDPFTEGDRALRPLTPAQERNPLVQQDARDRQAVEEGE